MESDPVDNITLEQIKIHSQENIKNVKNTISELLFNSKKILVCG